VIAIAFALLFAGFVAVACSMERHHRQVFARQTRQTASRLYRGAGLALIAAALAATVAVEGGSVGAVLWLGMMTAAAFAAALLLTYAPRTVPWAGAAAPLLGAVAAAMGSG
jgi:hypothetical protein